jgi:hypothetical protein
MLEDDLSANPPFVRPRKWHFAQDNSGRQQPSGRPYAHTLCLANGIPDDYLITDNPARVTCKSCLRKLPKPRAELFGRARIEEYAPLQFELQMAIPSFRTIPMILFCLNGHRHIDEHEFAEKPHHTHACQTCGIVWRPALVNTHGVQFLPGFKNP